MNHCSPQMTYDNGVAIFCDMGETESFRPYFGRVCTDRTEWTNRGWQAPYCG